MVEDIINLYKQKCIRNYQFRFACNGITMILVCLILGSHITNAVFIIFEHLRLKVNDLGGYYILIFSILIAEFIYMFILGSYLFYYKKSYIIKKITLLIEELVNETSKIKLIDNLNRIKKLRFNVKYLFNVSPIDKIFSKIKFDEFLEISKIDTPEKANDLKTKIYEYSKKERNFREYIDIAFLRVVVMAVLTPIIEYAQSVYIPNSLSSFNWENILIYLSTTFPIVAVPICINKFMHKYNNYNNISEKKGLLILSEKLNNYDFNISELEKCFEEVL
ncbi:hypothetical protein [Thomasclavelia ramosa]|uniref:Uncharacterized protein n=1 Tax=Thomasclavelia ramosa TaxID=1547 RepID=A0A3E3E8Q2_9FIRM|nr:hypothetical protein [Thomasclavelia ramosa]RGD77610.1 hypothetical protein DXB93_17845 [Thomasclavelia ramosa]